MQGRCASLKLLNWNIENIAFSAHWGWGQTDRVKPKNTVS